MNYNPLLSLLTLMLKLSQIWSVGTPLSWFCACHSEHIGTSGTRWSGVTLLGSALDSVSHFAKNSCLVLFWFFLFVFEWRVILEPKNWKLGVLLVTEVSLLMSFQWTDGRKIAISYHSYFSPYSLIVRRLAPNQINIFTPLLNSTINLFQNYYIHITINNKPTNLSQL